MKREIKEAILAMVLFTLLMTALVSIGIFIFTEAPVAVIVALMAFANMLWFIDKDVPSWQ